LRDYAAGLLYTREVTRRASLDDYAELVIARARPDPDLPRPAAIHQRRAHLERASATLEPLLRDAR
jgi:hypothetical protein